MSSDLPSVPAMRKELKAAGWRFTGGHWVSPKTGKPVIALNTYMPWRQMLKEQEADRAEQERKEVGRG